MEILIFMIIVFIISIIVVLFNYFLTNTSNKKEVIIYELLPKINCGICGYGSCMGMAKAVLKNKENINKCLPLKKEIKKDFLINGK